MEQERKSSKQVCFMEQWTMKGSRIVYWELKAKYANVKKQKGWTTEAEEGKEQ